MFSTKVVSFSFFDFILLFTFSFPLLSFLFAVAFVLNLFLSLDVDRPCAKIGLGLVRKSREQ